MALSPQEEAFIASIEYKIKEYDIPTNLNECLDIMSGDNYYTIYNTGEQELVDGNIEIYLIKSSFSYFINMYGKVDIPGLGTLAMQPYHFQSEMAKEIVNHRKIVLDKTRQCGMSTIFALYTLWKAHFFPAEAMDVVSIKQSKAQTFVKKISSTMKGFPEWMKTPLLQKNQQKIVFDSGDGSSSEIVSESQSDNAGRGDSLSVLIMDEAAFYQSDNMVRSIVSSAQPTLNKTGGQMIVISTPNGTSGKGGWYYEQVISARAGEKGCKYLEIDWWEIPDDDRIPGPKKGYNHILEKAIKEGYYYKPEVKKKYKKYFDPIAKDGYKDNEWLLASYKDLGEAKYRQEILHEFIIAGDKVFNEDVLDKVHADIIDPMRKNKLGSEQVDGLWTWKDPIPGHRYIFGIDVATGTGNDYSTIQVIDAGEYEQVCEYKGFISTPNFVRLIRKLGKFYNEAFLVIEANSIGEAVFNGLWYDEYEPYSNMYKQKKVKNGVTRFTGWTTDVKTRKLIVNDFIDWITVDELWSTVKIYSQRLWLEMTTWIWAGGNKAEHADGANDDSIIAFSLGMFNRNLAMKTGESFLITDDGTIISAGEKTTSTTIDENGFEVVTSTDPDEEDMYMKMYGCTKKDYDWLMG